MIHPKQYFNECINLALVKAGNNGTKITRKSTAVSKLAKELGVHKQTVLGWVWESSHPTYKHLCTIYDYISL